MWAREPAKNIQVQVLPLPAEPQTAARIVRSWRGMPLGRRYQGATDDIGYKAVENVTTIYDLHATILHLLGLNHTRLSFYNNGIERRLTDVHGHVIEPILA